MRLRELALKNVRQNGGRYAAYLGSAALAVMIYFLYTALALHPYFEQGYPGSRLAVEGIQAAAVVIAVFTLLFLLYSGAAFIRSRMKEFGLLAMLGFTRGQLVRMIVWENLIVACAALAIGLGLGLLFLKLFFMAISLVLQLPEELPLYLAWPVWRRTLLVFGGIFLLVSLLSLRGVLRRSIVELLRAGRKPKATPVFSWLRALAGLILVGGGYAWASDSSVNAVIAGVVPVTLMVSAGTYLLFREGSIALLQALRRVRPFYYRPGPFLTLSQLVFKVQDNYRVLTAVALLVAVILTAVGSGYSVYRVVADDALESFPQPVQIILTGEEDAARIAAQAEAILAEHGVTTLERVDVTVLRTQLDGSFMEIVNLVPYSVYERIHRANAERLPLEGDAAAIYIPAEVRFAAEGADGETVQLRVGEADPVSLRVVMDGGGRLFNRVPELRPDTLVVTDAVFEALRSHVAQTATEKLVIWTGPDWRGREVEAAVEALRALVGTGVQLTTTFEIYRSRVAGIGILLFIAVFVSLVFFAATCSLLYFRLFTEAEEDRRNYGKLRQLGLRAGEIRRLLGMQAGIIFFLPFLVGWVHATFALEALSTLIGRSVLRYGWTVGAVYFALHLLCFMVTYALYWRTLGVPAGRNVPTREEPAPAAQGA